MANEEGEEEFNEVMEQLEDEKSPQYHSDNEKADVEEGITRSKSSGDQELNDLKKSLENAIQELKVKDETIHSLKGEAEKLKQLKTTLSLKDAVLHSTKKELDVVQATMARTKLALCDNKKRVDELQAEVKRRKASEAKLKDSFVAQSKQLEDMNEMVERYKLEVVMIMEKMEKQEEERERSFEDFSNANDFDDATVRRLVDEIRVLKKELMIAMEAEETSNRAMDDLAIALKEVGDESQKTNEKLQMREEQLEAAKKHVEHLKRIILSTEHRHEMVLKDTKKENEQLRNTVDRLKKEAEESQLAWSGKEIEFVNCIKIAETEKYAAEQKNRNLVEKLREAEEMSANSKEENRKLRDILGQALNEANMAKEAANIAKEENSSLKDSLAEKEKVLANLAKETERLRISEAEASERITELRRTIALGSRKEAVKIENREIKKFPRKDPMSENALRRTGDSAEKEPMGRERKGASFSFDLNNLWPATTKTSRESDEEKDDALAGSIFDLVESPVAPKEPQVPKHYRRNASSCSDSLLYEQFEAAESYDEMEIDRHSHGKRNKALLKRFGDLLKRKNNHPPHHQKDLPKEIPPSLPRDVPT